MPKNSWIAYLDHGAFFFFISLFIVLHIAMVIWFYRVPFKHRKQMKQKDKQYRTSILGKMNANDNQSFSTTPDKTDYDHNSTNRDFANI